VCLRKLANSDEDDNSMDVGPLQTGLSMRFNIHAEAVIDELLA